jgi:hypothetical protein
VGPRAGQDRCGKSRLTGIQSPDRPARSQSLYRLRYLAHTTYCNIILSPAFYPQVLTLKAGYIIQQRYLFVLSDRDRVCSL